MAGKNGLSEICREHGIDLVYLFGSQVQAGLELLSGKSVPMKDPLTDIDVGVVFNGELPAARERYRLYARLYNQMSDLFGPFPLDLVFLQENHSVFQAEVIKGHCIHARNDAVRENYEEMILRRAADFRPFLEQYYQELLEEVDHGR